MTIDHSKLVDWVPLPSGECEADSADPLLIQTSLALLWKLPFKNTSKHKNNLIYVIKQEGLYQNKVTVTLASIHYIVKRPIGFNHRSFDSCIKIGKFKTILSHKPKELQGAYNYGIFLMLHIILWTTKVDFSHEIKAILFFFSV